MARGGPRGRDGVVKMPARDYISRRSTPPPPAEEGPGGPVRVTDIRPGDSWIHEERREQWLVLAAHPVEEGVELQWVIVNHRGSTRHCSTYAADDRWWIPGWVRL